MNKLDHAKTALLVCDYQTGIVARLGDKLAPPIARTAEVIAAARAATIPVIYVVVGFRPGYPEIDPNHATFGAIPKTGMMTTTTPGSDIVPELAPRAEEPVVIKRRVGAFQTTDLEVLLRARRIETIVLTGIATSGVILSTVRYASDADYRLVVVEDACADADEEVHRVLTTKVFPRQCTVDKASAVVAAMA